MHRGYIKLGAFIAALGVILGAFGAHFLKNYLSSEALATFHTGVNYQFYHSIALVLTGILLKRYPNNMIMWSGRLFMLGIIFFSGSLYLLALLEGFKGMDLGGFGILTPLGGLMFLGGWLALAVGIPNSKPAGND